MLTELSKGIKPACSVLLIQKAMWESNVLMLTKMSGIRQQKKPIEGCLCQAGNRFSFQIPVSRWTL